MLVTPNVVRWQWSGYTRAHGARFNLAVHLVTAPLFVLGVLGAIVALSLGRSAVAAVSGGGALIAFFAQAVGHAREANPPEPFRSPLDVVARVLVEQFVTFPRFVLSGGFVRAWRAAQR